MLYEYEYIFFYSVRQLIYQYFKVFNLLLALWDSNKYLADPLGPANDPLHHLLALLGQQMIACIQAIIC